MSDLTLNQQRFAPDQIPGSTKTFTEAMRQQDVDTEGLFDPKRLSDLRKLVPSTPEPHAGTYLTIPSREAGRTIPCVLVRPSSSSSSSSQTSSNGLFLHFHGGGMVLGSHDMNVSLLQKLADQSGCAILSVHYRLAPEHPFPAPVQDCCDAAAYVLQHPQHEDHHWGPLRFMGGESAGAYMSMQAFFHLAGNLFSSPSSSSSSSSPPKMPRLVLTYGLYAWTTLPSAHTLLNTVGTDLAKIHYFRDFFFDRVDMAVCQAFEPDFGAVSLTHPAITTTAAADIFQHPAVSPLFRPLDLVAAQVALPPALFLVGTRDPVLDDTVLMAAHWQMHGGQATVRFIEGSPHAFIEQPEPDMDSKRVGLEAIGAFCRRNE